MADLRALVEDLGYRDVRTVLNSGNVVFAVPGRSAGGVAMRIEREIKKRLGISSRVTVLKAAEIANIVAGNSLGAVVNNPSRLLVTVLAKPADRARLDSLARTNWAPEALAIGERVAYVWVPDGILKSRVMDAVSRALGDAATSRNWATITKLHALIQG